MFKPILEDKPISYVEERPQFYRSSYREAKWGSPVYFVPPGNYSGTGNYGPGCYKESTGGQKFDLNYKGTKLGNCTWWAYGRCLEVNGVRLEDHMSPINWNAKNWYKNYKGNKTGGSFGSSVKPGDVIVFTDSDCGHVIFVEKVEGKTIHISESAYSSKEIYRGKACIVYTLNADQLVEGKTIKLRPQLPFSDTCLGVIHTSEFRKDEPIEYELVEVNGDREEMINDLKKIREIADKWIQKS